MSSNPAFKSEEKEKLSELLTSIGEVLSRQTELSDRMDAVQEQLQYLTESGNRVGKKDWILQFHSIVNSLWIPLLTSQEARSTIAHIAMATLRSVAGWLPTALGPGI